MRRRHNCLFSSKRSTERRLHLLLCMHLPAWPPCVLPAAYLDTTRRVARGLLDLAPCVTTATCMDTWLGSALHLLRLPPCVTATALLVSSVLPATTAMSLATMRPSAPTSRGPTPVKEATPTPVDSSSEAAAVDALPSALTDKDGHLPLALSAVTLDTGAVTALVHLRLEPMPSPWETRSGLRRG